MYPMAGGHARGVQGWKEKRKVGREKVVVSPRDTGALARARSSAGVGRQHRQLQHPRQGWKTLRRRDLVPLSLWMSSLGPVLWKRGGLGRLRRGCLRLPLRLRLLLRLHLRLRLRLFLRLEAKTSLPEETQGRGLAPPPPPRPPLRVRSMGNGDGGRIKKLCRLWGAVPTIRRAARMAWPRRLGPAARVTRSKEKRTGGGRRRLGLMQP